MFSVIFEVQPRKERWDEYLELAKFLKPRLEAIDGFIDNERFGSKKHEGRLLSLSTWRDEKSVIRWRTQGEHHGVQEKGREAIFEDYHLRVGEIVTDTDPPIPIDEKRFDETSTGDAKFCGITEVVTDPSGSPMRSEQLAGLPRLDPLADGLLDHEVFESIVSPGKLLILTSWRDQTAASGWKPAAFEGARAIRHRQVRVIRDYGMFDRREAPQFYPPKEQTSPEPARR